MLLSSVSRKGRDWRMNRTRMRKAAASFLVVFVSLSDTHTISFILDALKQMIVLLN